MATSRRLCPSCCRLQVKLQSSSSALSPPRSPAQSIGSMVAAAATSSAARRGLTSGRLRQHPAPVAAPAARPGPKMDPSRIGFQRLPHHADAEQAHLEPEQHLRAGRHGEWVQDTLQAGAKSATNVWGVSLVPSKSGSERTTLRLRPSSGASTGGEAAGWRLAGGSSRAAGPEQQQQLDAQQAEPADRHLLA